MDELQYQLESNYDESFVSDSIFHDRMQNIPYRKLPKKLETIYIKRAKLSYYDENLPEELKELYIDYYGETDPKFKEAYESAEGIEKEEILNCAIEKSMYYRDEFLANNQRLAMKIAWRYVGFDMIEDLFQEGMEGMIKALEKFDVSQKNRFSTYAIWWIQESIDRYLADNKNTIRIPIRITKRIHKYNRILNELCQTLDHQPTEQEIVEKMNISSDQYQRMQIAKNEINMSSLDVPISEDDNTSLGDLVASDDIVFTDQIEDEMALEYFKYLIETSSLNLKSKNILYMFYGMNGFSSQSLEKVSEQFSLSRESIRQKRNRSLNTLSTDERIIELSDLFGHPYPKESKNNSNKSKVMVKTP